MRGPAPAATGERNAPSPAILVLIYARIEGRDEQKENAHEVEVPAGNVLVSIPLIRPSAKTVRANLYLEADVLAFIDGEAKRRSMTRKSYVTWMARRVAAMGG